LLLLVIDITFDVLIKTVSLSWLVFTYSLPAKSSSPRVTLWRRLRRIGAIALRGVQVLPEQDDCLEALQWLAQEVQQAKGESLIMRVAEFEGMSDSDVATKFREARQLDYADLSQKLDDFEQTFAEGEVKSGNKVIQETLEKLYKQHGEIQRIDFLACPEQTHLVKRLHRLKQKVLQPKTGVEIPLKSIKEYHSVLWMTRSRPHVDRLACIWLIRRFINPEAQIRYGKTRRSGEISFDLSQGDFQHQGNLCTFEVMLRSFGLEESGLQEIAEIVHEIDLRDGLYFSPQISGVETLLQGWLQANFTDEQLESYGIALFEGLYIAMSKAKS
jgi:hypothetical protein